MTKLHIDGYTYYHTTVHTSPFGGQHSDESLMKIHDNGTIVKMTKDEWNAYFGSIVINNDIEYDMIYYNPFIDYR